MVRRLVTVLSLAIASAQAAQQGMVSGELKKWHRVTITFEGPATAEGATPNPFRDFRLNVTFTHADRSVVVPGFYAADGNAAESGAEKGNCWRVHFTPDATGPWTYAASFRTGPDVALSDDPDAGTPAAFDGTRGTFAVGPSDKTGRDFRAKGLLRYVGKHHLQFAETREWFLKGGADSPENFLGYADFDGTYRHGATGGQRPGEASADKLHRYDPHLADWRPGDPAWRGDKGKGIIGALNYLASKGMNSVYFLTMNVHGDGKDVWPWTAHDERFRFDCSKLDQWEIVFSHMTRQGIALHVLTQETENDQLLDGGALGPQRRLYYRELVARFAHHPALVWNLGEENTNTTAELKAFSAFIRDLDPYDHPIVVHTFPGQYDKVYTPLLGYEHLEGTSLQTNATREQTLRWVSRSAAAGRPWVVCLDEIGPANTGVKPDADDPDHDEVRKLHLWGNLMAGGAGVEWYFGYKFPHNDLNCEDWRSRDRMWDQTRHALDFFQQHLPFAEMKPADGLLSARGASCLARMGEVYAIYLPNGGTTDLNFGRLAAPFNVLWFNPREGGALQEGTLKQTRGPGLAPLGEPPAEKAKDWVAIVKLPPGVKADASLAEVALAPPPAHAPRGEAGEVIGLTLINADTDQPVAGFDPIPDGAVLDLAKLPSRNLNIRANTRPALVGSVRFVLDDKAVKTEDTAPYALGGDRDGDYGPWTPAPGGHTLAVTAHSEPKAGGVASKPLTIRFMVTGE